MANPVTRFTKLLHLFLGEIKLDANVWSILMHFPFFGALFGLAIR